MKKIILLIALISITGSASAACDRFTNTVDVMSCLRTENTHIEARLSATYKAILDKLSHNERDGLLQAQRLWVRFKNADCTAVMKRDEGGTIAGIVWQSCINEKAQRREAELRELYPDR